LILPAFVDHDPAIRFASFAYSALFHHMIALERRASKELDGRRQS